MAINAISYLTGNTTYQTGMFKRATVGANMSSLLTGSFKWWNKVDALATQYLIYTDSYTTERTDQANSVPVCWSTPDLNDQSLVNLINTIPERVGDLPFTNINQSLYWLQNTNKYFLLKNGYENIVTDGLVLNLDAGWYDSYPAAGSTWTDLSGNGYNATLYNNPTFGSTDGGYIDFDGSDDYGNLGNISALGFTSGVFTAEAWVYIPSTWTSGSQYPNLISKGASAGWDNAGWSLFVFRDWPNPGNYSWGCGIRQGGTALITAKYNVPSNTFLHIVATADGSNVRLYQNGILVYTNSQTVVPESNSREVFIGVDWVGNYFPGNLALTRLYNKALSATEVQQNFVAQKTRFGLTGSTVPTDGLVMYLDASNQISYPTTGTSWYDLSGVNNSGTLVNSPTYNSTNGGVIVFDGTDDYVDVGSNSSLTTNTVTMCVFVYPQNTRPEEIISTANQGSGFRFMTRVYASNTGTLWGFRPTPFDSEYVGTTQLTNNQWYFLVVTYSTSQLKLYLNANLETTVNSPSGIVYGGDIRFGDGIGGAQQHLQGYIGAYLQYNRVLDSSEITQIFNGLKGKYGL